MCRSRWIWTTRGRSTSFERTACTSLWVSVLRSHWHWCWHQVLYRVAHIACAVENCTVAQVTVLWFLFMCSRPSSALNCTVQHSTILYRTVPWLWLSSVCSRTSSARRAWPRCACGSSSTLPQTPPSPTTWCPSTSTRYALTHWLYKVGPQGTAAQHMGVLDPTTQRCMTPLSSVTQHCGWPPRPLAGAAGGDCVCAVLHTLEAGSGALG